MVGKTIVCPTDFSPASEAALRYATSLARDSGAKLIILHVDESPLDYGAAKSGFGKGGPLGHPKLEALLSEVVSTDPDVQCEHRLAVGDPAREIISVADETEADMIVMSTHGRTGLMRLLMGSVAEIVVRQASCPVLTVKEPNDIAIGAS